MTSPVIQNHHHQNQRIQSFILPLSYISHRRRGCCPKMSQTCFETIYMQSFLTIQTLYTTNRFPDGQSHHCRSLRQGQALQRSQNLCWWRQRTELSVNRNPSPIRRGRNKRSPPNLQSRNPRNLFWSHLSLCTKLLSNPYLLFFGRRLQSTGNIHTLCSLDSKYPFFELKHRNMFWTVVYH